MSKKIFFDNSWSGMGGIGRFSDEIKARLYNKGWVEVFSLKFRPSSFIASFLYSIYSLVKSDAVFFFPGFVPPLISKSKFIFVVHDLNHVDLDFNSNFLKRFFYEFVIRRQCHKAEKVLTVSEFSRQRIISWAGTNPSNVVNVYNGVDNSFFHATDIYTPGYKYLLCVSNRKQHKNEHRTLLAFKKSCISPDIKLLFTGDVCSSMKEFIDENELSKRIIFLGKVKESELCALYRGSLGLVFPSLYEGFGLPVVEAMACGVPVLTSNTTSLPEVAGDAALLVNPESVDEIRAGIERLVNDEALRTELIAKGLDRAKLFSWDAVAARVQAVLDEVTNQHAK